MGTPLEEGEGAPDSWDVFQNSQDASAVANGNNVIDNPWSLHRALSCSPLRGVGLTGDRHGRREECATCVDQRSL
jgi:hypothetical protein